MKCYHLKELDSSLSTIPNGKRYSIVDDNNRMYGNIFVKWIAGGKGVATVKEEISGDVTLEELQILRREAVDLFTKERRSNT